MPLSRFLRLAVAPTLAAIGCSAASPPPNPPAPGPAAAPTATPSGTAAASAEKPNTHGMFMVGTGTLYLVHMPMFHKPDHQYQAIFRAHLDAATTRTYLADRAANPAEAFNLINVDEEPFLLTDLPSGKIKTFHVNVYRGYSNDNGGTPGKQIAAKAELTIDAVVRFRHFDPAATRPDKLTYVLFGDGAEAHLDHSMVREPDFQHVLTLPAVPAWASKEQLQKGIEISVPVPRASVGCKNPLPEASYPVTIVGSTEAARPLNVGAAASRWFSTGNMLNLKDPCDPSAAPHPM